MIRRKISSGSGTPVTGIRSNVHADIDEDMAEQQGDHAHSQEFAQAIARLAGDADPGEQRPRRKA